jgi:hypothetical protein
MPRLLLGLLAAGLLAGLDARADGWATTFEPAAVASQFDGKAAFIVVPAGDGDPAPAAAALEAALKAGDCADLVMNGKSLGTTAELDDPAIVKKASSLPVARIAVVRVFGAKAVVTVYDPRANVVVAFSGDEGQPMSGRAGAAVGVSAETTGALAVLRTEKHAKDPKKEALKQQFLEKAVWFPGMLGLGAFGGGFTGWSDPVQGLYGKTLDGDAFYLAVGRPDLAERYRDAAGTRKAVLVGGALATLASLVLFPIALSRLNGGNCYGLTGAELTACSNESSEARQAREDAASASFGHWMIASGVALVAGSVALIAGGMIDPHPIAAPEARRLADAYDRQLLGSLGLTDDDFEGENVPLPKKSALELGPTFGASPGGVTAGVAGRF